VGTRNGEVAWKRGFSKHLFPWCMYLGTGRSPIIVPRSKYGGGSASFFSDAWTLGD
jgi:hypothetical protein